MIITVDLDVKHQLKQKRWTDGNMGLRPLRPKEIDELLVPTGKASTLLTDHLITGLPLWSQLVQEKWLKANHPYI